MTAVPPPGPEAPPPGVAAALAEARAPLIETMKRQAARGITCSGCDARCCTERFNSMQLTAPEAWRIGRALTTVPGLARRLAEWKARIRYAIDRWSLAADGPRRRYTCPFLEPDRSCALPPSVKPLGCLSYNPDAKRRCDHDAEAFWKAHDRVAQALRRAARPAGGKGRGTRPPPHAADGAAAPSVPIPVGVATALGIAPAPCPPGRPARATTEPRPARPPARVPPRSAPRPTPLRTP